MLPINEESYLNIIFIYVTTPILVRIFSLRSETHGKQHFNNKYHKQTHNNKKNTSNCLRIAICIRMQLCNPYH
jgi:hypothetical protein